MFDGIAFTGLKEYNIVSQEGNSGKPQLCWVQETPNTKWFQRGKMHCLAGAHKHNAKEGWQKARISVLIYDKVKSRLKSRKQKKEGLVYAEDQNSREAFERFKHNQMTIQPQRG